MYVCVCVCVCVSKRKFEKITLEQSWSSIYAIIPRKKIESCNLSDQAQSKVNCDCEQLCNIGLKIMSPIISETFWLPEAQNSRHRKQKLDLLSSHTNPTEKLTDSIEGRNTK